jgi:uncharacterized protein (TIGR00369 family)
VAGLTAWEPANPGFAEAVGHVLATMPAARYLGFRVSRLAPGEAELIQPYRKELTQGDGYFQGGVLGSLADFAGGAAAGTLLPDGWANMTIDYTVKIVAPGKGDELIARGRVIKPGSVLSIAAADVYSVDAAGETLCSVAFITLRNIRLPKRDTAA